MNEYESYINDAVTTFWKTRNDQQARQLENGIQDYGTRGAVTGGKQLDGFISLFEKVAMDAGVVGNAISIRNNILPGYFRPTKDWDVLITIKNKLIAAIELKSQVGSFGNNFNNRTEEAIGTAVDFWTAHRYEAYKQSFQPWVGYFLLLEKSEMSTRSVSISEPIFSVFPEFKNTSYMQRYDLLCKKMMIERHYSQAAVLWTTNKLEYGDISKETSLGIMIDSLKGYLIGKKDYLK